MSRAIAGMVLLALAVLVPGCCCPEQRVPPSNECKCHPEQPFVIPVQAGPPAYGMVLGTADFLSSGTVLVKVQVENLETIDGDEATITVWSGQGDVPATGTVPPPGGTPVYQTTGDVMLRHYTTHLDRTYDPAIDSYWLFVRVDLDHGDNTREERTFVWTWQPSTTANPDEPHFLIPY